MGEGASLARHCRAMARTPAVLRRAGLPLTTASGRFLLGQLAQHVMQQTTMVGEGHRLRGIAA